MNYPGVHRPEGLRGWRSGGPTESEIAMAVREEVARKFNPQWLDTLTPDEVLDSTLAELEAYRRTYGRYAQCECGQVTDIAIVETSPGVAAVCARCAS